MKETNEKIKLELEEALKGVNTEAELANVKAEFLGKSGMITGLSSKIKDLSNEEKKEFGKSLNEIKTFAEELINSKGRNIEEKILNDKLEKERIDVSLPGVNIKNGSPSMIEGLIENLEELFLSMGYDVVEGPEVEKDLYNFELLNLPKGHPARDAQDTFYIKDEEILLRSQTSPVQVRTMLANEDKSSIKIICPGKTYRRDDDDATHTHQFTQMEGLLIDKGISLADLKGTTDVIAKHLFGENTETRFRSSFYPFTEPSVEFDVSCHACEGKGCPICKHTGWITVGGAGMVHPKVLRNCGYNPDEVSGFAFGFGIERLAMLKYGVTDARTFYTNDLRVNFDRKDV